MGHGHDGQPGNPDEVAWVARVDWEIVSQCGGGDHCVVGACGWLAPSSTQRRRDLAEAPSRGSVKWKGLEICFCLLEVGLPSGLLSAILSHQWTDRQLRKCDGRYEGLIRQ